MSKALSGELSCPCDSSCFFKGDLKHGGFFPGLIEKKILSSPLAGKQDVVVTTFVRCMVVHPPRFVRTITCTIMHGFQNSLAQLLPLRRRSAICNIF